ncbi:hypothetical protein U9M48_023495 [Paspalum notatum var. saurae]|uniref:Uncharacterized protein n=1 Tax=Paspalum notatum var. saurae TaxID=547442 RepID=A0AAQ3WVU4_PASNO
MVHTVHMPPLQEAWSQASQPIVQVLCEFSTPNPPSSACAQAVGRNACSRNKEGREPGCAPTKEAYRTAGREAAQQPHQDPHLQETSRRSLKPCSLISLLMRSKPSQRSSTDAFPSLRRGFWMTQSSLTITRQGKQQCAVHWYIAIGLNSYDIKLWDSISNRLLRTLRGVHESRVISIPLFSLSEYAKVLGTFPFSERVIGIAHNNPMQPFDIANLSQLK